MLKHILLALGALYVAGNFYYCSSQDEKLEQQRTASVSNECKSVKRLEAIEGLDLSSIRELACEVQS